MKRCVGESCEETHVFKHSLFLSASPGSCTHRKPRVTTCKSSLSPLPPPFRAYALNTSYSLSRYVAPLRRLRWYSMCSSRSFFLMIPTSRPSRVTSRYRSPSARTCKARCVSVCERDLCVGVLSKTSWKKKSLVGRRVSLADNAAPALASVKQGERGRERDREKEREREREA